LTFGLFSRTSRTWPSLLISTISDITNFSPGGLLWAGMTAYFAAYFAADGVVSGVVSG
jgi:hypothetical protein